MKKNLPIQIVFLSLLVIFSNTLISKPPKLNNFGVSCYFNAIIQSLNATKPLIDNLEQLEYDPKQSHADVFPQKFKSLLEAIQNNEFEKITAALHAFYLASVDKIIELQPHIKKTNDLIKDVAAVIQQEDASEFLTLLIDELKKDELSAKTINDIFFFQEVVHINEFGENPIFRENKEQPNNQLSLPVFEEIEIEGEEPKISKSTSVKESLDIYFAEGGVLIKKEVFEYDEIQETYVSVDKYIPSTKQGFLDQLSEILIITLKRFYYAEGSNQKFQSSIEIPLELDLEKYCTKNVTNPNYQLYALVNHRGDRANSGHYVAYVKENRNWYRCDDSTITPVEFEKVKNEIYKDGYILFYQKKSEEAEQEEVNEGLRKEMKEAIAKELERSKKSRPALLEKIKATQQQKEKEQEEESLKLARQLEAEESEAEAQRLQKKQEEEKLNLEKALEFALEEQEFPERKGFEEIRQQQIKQQKEREEAATQELIRKLQEEDVVRLEAERQRRELEIKKSEEEALRLAIEQQENYLPEIEQRKIEEIKRKEQENRRKEQEERAKQVEIRLEKERKEKVELTRLEKQRAEKKRAAQRKEHDEKLISALMKLNNALQQMLNVLTT